MNNLVIGIITFNEEIHLNRCLKNLSKLNRPIFILDSYSNDNTSLIAKKYNVNFYKSKFSNYSDQRNKLLEIIKDKSNCEYLLIIDADEYLSSELIDYIEYLERNSLLEKFDGYYITRKFIWKKKWIKFGNYYPRYFLRLVNINKVKLDNKPVNEHYILSDHNTLNINFDIIDENLNGIKFWTLKHLKYAKLEALAYFSDKSNKSKKFIIYDSSPLILRSFFYFLYIYIVKLGILDGFRGSVYHLIHSLFYRIVIDIMIIRLIIKNKILNK